MEIRYRERRMLELWVRDVGAFDGIAIYLNGKLIERIGDQQTVKFAIERPPGPTEIIVHFGGNDGGISAVVDVTDIDQQRALGKQTQGDGLRHAYRVVPTESDP
jgi:hypothetical protein